MVLLLLCLLTLQCPAHAKSARTIHLADGQMEQIYVEPGYSTLLKFRSHPEPGLIGDQDGFKIEYLKNIVAIKPLVSKGKTNLFIFTKDGQFNFQLIAARGAHDNVVYVEPRVDNKPRGMSGVKVAVPVDALQTRKINKSAAIKNIRLNLESISMPASRTTFVLRFTILTTEQKAGDIFKVEPGKFQVMAGKRPIKIENIFLEERRKSQSTTETSGLILIRASELHANDDLRVVVSTQANAKTGQLQVIIGSDLIQRKTPL